MRSTSRFLFAALLALSWTGLASAETPGSQPSIEPGLFADMTATRLEDAFEKSASRADEATRYSMLAGPTTMTCRHAMTRSALETCVVTTEGTPRPAAPAALAQH